MAVDLKIEEFSTKLFKRLWNVMFGVQTFYHPRKRYYCNEIPEACEVSDDVFHAVWYRALLFHYGYTDKFHREFYRFSKSGVEFYSYILHCYYRYAYNLNIFDKFLFVCSVTAHMGASCFMYRNDIYVETAPLCCAMCIDIELKDEFYNAGGWEELRRQSSTYTDIFTYFEMGDRDIENAFMILNKASKNYNMEQIKSHFHKRWLIITKLEKELELCPKCSLLSSAFTVFSAPDEFPSTDSIYFERIESLLQLALIMRSIEKEFTEVSSVSEELEKLSVCTKCSDDSRLDSKTNFEKQDGDNQISIDYKVILTLKLLRKLFGEPRVMEFQEKLDSTKSNEFFTCMLCLETNPLRTFKAMQLEQEQLVLSKIKREIKFSTRKLPAAISDTKIVHPHPIKVKEKQKDVNEECEIGNNPENVIDEQKKKLRMFIALGTEPAKFLILKESNVSNFERSEMQQQKAGTNKRKKKQKKKKNKETVEK